MTAHGAKYRAFARRAAWHIKLTNPDLPVHIYSDAPIDDPSVDEVTVLDGVWHRSRLDSMLTSPFDETLALDVDIFVTLPIGDIFDTLAVHDIAACHDQNRSFARRELDWDMPNAMPQLNGGVVAYRKSDAALDFIRRWRDHVQETNAERDQPTFRKLAYEGKARMAILPPEYNLQNRQSFTFRYRNVAPRVMHVIGAGNDEKYLTSRYPVLLFLGPKLYQEFLEAILRDSYIDETALPPFARYGQGRAPILTRMRLTALYRQLLMTSRFDGGELSDKEFDIL